MAVREGNKGKQSMSVQEIVDKVWMSVVVPDRCPVKTMLLEDERKLLYYLASEYCRGHGCIVDAGCFLGGSTTALALGVRDRQRRTGRRTSRKVHSYDLFETEAWTIGNLLPSNFLPGQSFQDLFHDNIRDVASLVQVHAGDITSKPWTGGPIELLFVDCAKHWRVSDFITAEFFSSLIPGHSIVVHQDYIWECWNAWIHITMEYFADCFRLLTYTPVNSVVFLYEREISGLRPNLVGSMDVATKLRLMKRARGRFGLPQLDYLERSHRQYQTSQAWTSVVDAERLRSAGAG
jgi:hypothetical protein